ncbi:MAG: hypothetical protein NTX25_06990 [Proteobacteria bacterium]|nr:hypothetical protein [Pseudomonadota bacterium]
MKILAIWLFALNCMFVANLALGDTFEYTVLGVIASSQNQHGVALIKQKATGKVNAFREGQELDPNCRIMRISRKIVTFSYNNKSYAMSVGDESPTEIKNADPSMSGPTVADNLYKADGIERNGNTLKVTRSLKDSLIGENLNKILMQAAAVPHVKDGHLIGFELLEINKGSIFDIAGLKDGDIVTHINEQPINDAGLAIKTLSKLKSSPSATFGYLRGTQVMELVIQTN